MIVSSRVRFHLGRWAIVSALLARPALAGEANLHANADVIVAWNQTAYDIAFGEDQFLTFKGQRALAMMHLAMHDALNTIAPAYERYAYAGPRVVAHPVAAAAQAAHDVLVALYPERRATLTAALPKWLNQAPPGALRDGAVDLGRHVAAAVLASRNGDGWDFPGSYQFQPGPGEYQTTPPWDGFVAQPGFRSARPFVRVPPGQVRVSPPPRLSSAAYARALNEVKVFGALNSPQRTDDQTAYAIWWMEFAEGSVNRVARRLVADRGMHLWRTARLFAHVGIALFDVYIAVWDAKYAYNHWRPYTAVRAADADGNPHTSPDAGWEPMRPSPPHPEYVSAHAAGCAASFDILEDAFGGDLSFTMETTTAPPEMATRAFESFDDAARECADSRVRLGWHFRYSTEAGRDLGRRLAKQIVRRSLRAVR